MNYVKILDAGLPLDIEVEHANGGDGVRVRLERVPVKVEAADTPQCCNCAAWGRNDAGTIVVCHNSEAIRAVGTAPGNHFAPRADFGCIHFTLRKGG